MFYQIAKDMERWAKTVNAAKAAQKQQLKALIELERAEVAARDVPEDPQPLQQQISLSTEVKRSGISLTAALEVSLSDTVPLHPSPACLCAFTCNRTRVWLLREQVVIVHTSLVCMYNMYVQCFF